MALAYGLILLPHMNNLIGDVASTKVTCMKRSSYKEMLSENSSVYDMH